MRYRRLDYKRYEGIVKSLAELLAQKDNELSDLIGEGALAYVEARKSYDRERGEFSTHLWWKALGRMKSYQRKGRINPHIDADIPAMFFGSHQPEQEARVGFKQFLESLSAEAFEVVKTIFEAPAELYEYTTQKGLRPKALARFFVKERGWKFEKVWEANKEIADKLKTL
ncbi:MAG: sigma factor [Syntrophorhabdaceae bacterium]|nr:sigma factor [Syntrophorhabdaceae bacterium]